MKTCKFCGETEGLTTCDHPIWEFVSAHYFELKVGDSVRRWCEKREGRPPARVTEVQTYYIGSLSITLSIKGRPKKIVVKPTSLVRVLRDRNCDQVCCELHRCERGPGATFCADHWMSLEMVA
jgi:hypothetical protein